MSGLLIDLTAARAKRAVDLQAAMEATQAVLDNVAEIARGYASLAFTISGPLWSVNQQFAVDINRSQWRRMRSVVRRMTRLAHPQVKVQLAQWADVNFVDRLMTLGADVNAMWGSA